VKTNRRSLVKLSVPTAYENIFVTFFYWLGRDRGVTSVKSQWSYLQSTHPAGGPSGQEAEEQTEVTRWVITPDLTMGLGLSLK